MSYTEKIIINLLLILYSVLSFSQNEGNIIFNIKSNILVETLSGNVDSLEVLKANVVTAYGKFSLQLVDANKDTTFNNFGKNNSYLPTIESNMIKNDGIFISKYKSKSINTLFDGEIQSLSSSTKFIFNGVFFKLYNLKRISEDNYEAKLKILKEDVDFEKAFKKKYLTFVDKLNSMCVKSVDNKKETNILSLLKNKYLYIKFIDADIGIDSPSSVDVNYMEGFDKFSKINVIYLIVNSDKQMIKTFKTVKFLKHDVYYLEKNLKNMMTLGCNYYPLSILFNKKGELVSYNIFPFDLKNYDK